MAKDDAKPVPAHKPKGKPGLHTFEKAGIAPSRPKQHVALDLSQAAAITEDGKGEYLVQIGNVNHHIKSGLTLAELAAAAGPNGGELVEDEAAEA